MGTEEKQMKRSHDQNSTGLVWVEEGVIKVKDPGPGGSPATIRPADGVDIFVSGSKAIGETAVFESSEISVQPRCKEPVSSYKIQVTKDGLEFT